MTATFGRWSKVAVAAGGIIAELHGVVGASMITDFLECLLDAQPHVTGPARDGVAVLRDAPMRAGLERLESARRVGVGDSLWTTYITEAERQFSMAYALVDRYDERALMLVEFNHGMVFVAMAAATRSVHARDCCRAEARYHLERSAEHAERALRAWHGTSWWPSARARRARELRLLVELRDSSRWAARCFTDPCVELNNLPGIDNAVRHFLAPPRKREASRPKHAS